MSCVIIEAIAKYEKRVADITLANEQIGIWYKILGSRYIDLKMWGEALSCYQKAIEYYPENQNLYYYVGVCAGYMAHSALDYDARDIFVYASVFLLAGRGATGLFDVAFETCIEIFANLAIFEDVFAEVRTTEPVGVPTADDAKSVGDRIDFLTHCCCF